MIPILVLVSIFAAGFGCGYGVRAWRSHRRSARYRLYAPYTPSSTGAEAGLHRDSEGANNHVQLG